MSRASEAPVACEELATAPSQVQAHLTSGLAWGGLLPVGFCLLSSLPGGMVSPAHPLGRWQMNWASEAWTLGFHDLMPEEGTSAPLFYCLEGGLRVEQKV